MNLVSLGEKHTAEAAQASETVDWYVYYRVRAERAALLQVRVGAMQNSLRQKHGITCALKQQPQLRDGMHTWMEVYLSAPAAFEAILASEARHVALTELIEGERHVEYFRDLTSCA